MTRRMRTILTIFGAVVLGLALLGLVYLAAPKPPLPDLSLSRLSQKGLYRVTLEPGPGALTVGGIHEWTVSVVTPDGKPVIDAQFSFSGGMRAHGHGLPTSPEVTAELGGGRYRIEGVKFSMGGAWQFVVAITAAAGSDRADFNIQI